MTLFDRHQVKVFAADHSGDKTTQYNGSWKVVTSPISLISLFSCGKPKLLRRIWALSLSFTENHWNDSVTQRDFNSWTVQNMVEPSVKRDWLPSAS